MQHLQFLSDTIFAFLLKQKSAVAKLERELTDVKIAIATPTDSDAAKFKYLDDKYTEAATKCYNMKLEVWPN